MTARAEIDLIANDRASRAFDKAGRSMQGLDAKSKSMRNSMRQTGASMSAAGMSATTKLTLPIIGIGAAVLLTAGRFEKSMNKVAAISGATGEDFEALESQAKELGRTTMFSASQAADAMSFLAMAGFETNDILTAMPATLNLAAAGNLELAEAADIASNVLTSQRMEAEELGHVNDVLAKAFTSANTDLRQLGQAFKFAGPLVQATGTSFEEATAALALMGNAGIQATMAGTALRGGLTRLLNPTKQISERMKKLGLATKDSEGNLLPLHVILKNLKKSGADASDMMVIFGQRAGPAMQALLSQSPAALRELTAELENAGGTAQEIADKQMEGLMGALTRMKSALEGLMIAIADSGLLDAFTGFIENVVGLIGKLTELDPKVMQTIVILGGLLAAIGPILLIGGKLLILFAAIASPIGIAVLAIGALVAAFVIFRDDLQPIVDAVAGKLQGLWARVQPILAALANKARTLFVGLKNWWDAHGGPLVETISTAWDGIVTALDPITSAFEDLFGSILPDTAPTKDEVLGYWEALKQQPGVDQAYINQWDAYVTQFGRLPPAMEAANKASQGSTGILDEVSTAWDGFNTELDGAMTTFNETFGTGFGQATTTHQEFNTKTGEMTTVTTEHMSGLTGAIEVAFASLPAVVSTSVALIRTALLPAILAFDAVKGAVQGVISFVSENFDDIAGTAGDVVGTIQGIVTGDFDGAMKSMQSYASRMKRLVSSAFTTLQTTVGTVTDAMASSLETAWTTIDTTITNIADGLGADVGQAWRDLKDNTYTFFGQMGTKIGTTLSGIASGFKTHLGNAKNTVNNIMGSIASIIRNAVSKIINFWNSLDFHIPRATISWDGWRVDLNNSVPGVKLFTDALGLGDSIQVVSAGSATLWNRSGDLIPDIGGVSGGGGGSGSGGRQVPLAQGALSVPYDNFPALLHRDEMVVPRKFADAIRGEIGSGPSGNIINVNIENNFGRGSVRNDEDVKAIGVEQATRMRMLGLSTFGTD